MSNTEKRDNLRRELLQNVTLLAAGYIFVNEGRTLIGVPYFTNPLSGMLTARWDNVDDFNEFPDVRRDDRCPF